MPYSKLTDEDLVRLVTVRFMPGRFKGRQALEAEAVKGDVLALAKLEMQLGLADKSALREAYERRLANMVSTTTSYRHGLSPEMFHKLARVPQGKRVPWILGMVARHEEVRDAEQLVPPEEIARIQKTQQSRWYANDPYEQKLQEFQLERHLKKRLDEALAKTRWAWWRYHRNRIAVVPRGEERVEVESIPRWTYRSGGGWGRGRRRSETVFEMEDRRKWYLSTALLSPATREMQLKNTRGVYLSPVKRVRRGKDNSTMITEVLSTTQPNTQTALPWGKEIPRWIRRG
jgi:hypothetical protein